MYDANGNLDSEISALIEKSNYGETYWKTYYEGIQNGYADEEAAQNAADNALEAEEADKTLELMISSKNTEMYDANGNLNSEISALIEKSNYGETYWSAYFNLIHEGYSEEAAIEQAAVAEQEKNDAVNYIVMLLASGKTIEDVADMQMGQNTSGRDLIEKSGYDVNWWRTYEAANMTSEGETPFHGVSASAVQYYQEEMNNITSFDDAEEYAELIAYATGNEDFAMLLLQLWWGKAGYESSLTHGGRTPDVSWTDKDN